MKTCEDLENYVEYTHARAALALALADKKQARSREAPEQYPARLQLAAEKASVMEWAVSALGVEEDAEFVAAMEGVCAALTTQEVEPRGRRTPPEPAEVTELRERVQKLEAQVEALSSRLGAGAEEHDEVVVAVDPHGRWIETHLDELRKYPDTWVLLDAEEGIVFHTKDEAAFTEELARRPREDRHRLMPFNTRMYV